MTEFELMTTWAADLARELTARDGREWVAVVPPYEGIATSHTFRLFSGVDVDTLARDVDHGGEELWVRTATIGTYWKPAVTGCYRAPVHIDARIGFSYPKPAARLAADIVRRLLPDYRSQLAEAREKQRHVNEYQARTKASLARLVAAGAELNWNGELVFLDGAGYARPSGDRVNFDVTVPIEIAERIVALILEGER